MIKEITIAGKLRIHGNNAMVVGIDPVTRELLNLQKGEIINITLRKIKPTTSLKE